MEQRLIEKIRGISYNNVQIDDNLEWLSNSPNNALNEISLNNVVRFLLKEVRYLSEQIKGLKDFYYGFSIITEPNESLCTPKIGWERAEFIEKEDSHIIYYMNGYSEDGREWKGSALYCLDDIVEYPLEDGFVEEITKL